MSQIVEPSDEFANREAAWFKYHRYWMFTYRALGVVALATSILAAADAKIVGENAPRFYSLVSALAVAVLGFLNPQKRASAFGRAYRGLYIARQRIRYPDASSGAVIDAIAAGESIITDSDPTELPDIPAAKGVGMAPGGPAT